MENKSLKEFTEMTASKEPVPGGGGVSAAAGALAASLGEMVTNLTIGKKRYLEYTYELELRKKELEVIRINLLGCINKDAEAFEPLAAAYALPRDSEGYAERMEKCLRDAADSPLLIMRYCCRIIELAERLAVIGSKLSVSDAACSVMLAHGAMYAAYVNIIVNTRLMKDKEYAGKLEAEAEALLKEHGQSALQTFDSILGRIKG